MADKYWFKLHRKIKTSPVFDNPKLLKTWIWCLCEASFKERDQIVGKQIVHLKRGQFVFGRFAAARELNLNDRTVYDYMKLLEKLEMITINSNNKFSVVSVVNWVLYQDKENENQQQTTSKVSNENTIKNDTIKKDKTDKQCKDKNKVHSDEQNALFERVWKLYPSKIGKKHVSAKSKKRLLELGEEQVIRAINRYKQGLQKDTWRNPQNGSTFFNSGIDDYLDEKYHEIESEVQKGMEWYGENQSIQSWDD